ncbi:MAG: biopolymer transporter ExbD [Pseudomonadota bacterium]|nr:biopolymer transporter ExbD [Pseudomonadota bacterium]
MAMSGGKEDGAPMMEMNTTPLIDVMLCLLIMFIMSIPVATHAINIDLPVNSQTPNDPPPVDPIRNKVVLTVNDDILWNGTPVDGPGLLNLLQQSLQYEVEPELQFQPEPNASYELSAQVLQIIKGSNVSKFGFVGNEQFAEFSK